MTKLNKLVFTAAIGAAISFGHTAAGAEDSKASKFTIKLETGYARLSAPDWRSGISLTDLSFPPMFSADPDSNGFRVGLTVGTDIGNIFGPQRRTGWRLEAFGSFARAGSDANATVGTSIVMLVAPFGLTQGFAYLGPLDERLRTTLTDIETGIRLRLPSLGGKRFKISPYVQLAYGRYAQDYRFTVRQTGNLISDQTESLVTNNLLFGAGANLKFVVTRNFHISVGGAILLDAAFARLDANQSLIPSGGMFPPVIGARYREDDNQIGYRARFSAGAMYKLGRISLGVQVDGDFRSYTPQAIHTSSFDELLGGARPLRLGDSTILNYSVSAVVKVSF